MSGILNWRVCKKCKKPFDIAINYELCSECRNKKIHSNDKWRFN